MDYAPYLHKLPRIISDWMGDLSDSVVMDFGCGSGALALGLAPSCKKVFGVEINQKYEDCRAIADSFDLQYPDNLEFIRVEAGQTDIGVEFDCIYSWSVFEHVD